MKSEKHITGLKYLREKLKSGEAVEKPKPKPTKIQEVEIIEEKINIVEIETPEPKTEIIKDKIKKLLTYEEESKIPKV